MSNRLIGYARVSTADHLDAQRDELVAAACGIIFADHGASGSLTTWAKLDRCLSIGTGPAATVQGKECDASTGGHCAVDG